MLLQCQDMETVLQAGVSAQGTCSRLKFQSMPYSLTLISTGFLQIFLMFLPTAIITVTTHAPSGDHPAFGLLIYFFTCVLMLGWTRRPTSWSNPFHTCRCPTLSTPPSGTLTGQRRGQPGPAAWQDQQQQNKGAAAEYQATKAVPNLAVSHLQD